MRIVVQRAEYRYRDYPWTAIERDYDLGKPIGSGPTPEAAVEDLLWHLDIDELPPHAVVTVKG